MDSDLAPLNEEQFQANRFDLVSRLADDLAHEIKNPLNAIVINLEVLKVRVGRGDTGAALERAAVIEHEAHRLHHVIDRLLQLLRPEREEATNLALDQVLDELLPLVEARVRLAHNTFTRDCAATVYLPVARDIFKFALLNLLTAVHERLGEKGGALSLSCDAAGQNVRLRIEAVVLPEAAPLAPAGADYDRLIAVGAALLRVCGGSLEVGTNGVTVVVPRS